MLRLQWGLSVINRLEHDRILCVVGMRVSPGFLTSTSTHCVVVSWGIGVTIVSQQVLRTLADWYDCGKRCGTAPRHRAVGLLTLFTLSICFG